MPGEKESKDCLLFKIRDYVGSHLYPINRLDRPVSGIVLFAKKPEVVTKFQEIWHNSSTKKKYLCLHKGKLERGGIFNSSLSKKSPFKSEKSTLKQEAITRYNPLVFFEKEYCTFTEAQIKTGRYHQIRRHFRKVVMPIVGDRKHGKGKLNRYFEEKFNLNRIFLHSYKTSFYHPYSGIPLEFTSPLPNDLSKVLESLKN